MKQKFVYLITIVSLLIFAGILLSQQGKVKMMSDFQDKWKMVEEFSQQGLPKSALEVIEQIYQSARKTGNHTQVVKALIYRMRFRESIEEDALLKNISDIEQEIKGSKFPATAILQSMLAQLYWSYYQQNRYKILDRTQLSGQDSNDPAVWGAPKFVEKSGHLYHASLKNVDKLKDFPLDQYEAIIVKQAGSRVYRPTLYDLLAHRAVDFFMNEETGLTKPAYQFQMRGENVFAPAEDFIKVKFESQDPQSFQFQALLILQDLVRQHLDDRSPEALADVDLKRLKFARQHSINPAKDDLYFQALETLEKKHLDHPVSTGITYEIAVYYQETAGKYQPGQEDDSHKWDYKKAYQICQEGVNRFPDSDGAFNCQVLQNRITRKSLSMEMEKVNLPEKPFRALVNYMNVKTVYLRVTAISFEERKEAKNINFNAADWIKFYLSRPAAKEWRVELPDDGDYRNHSVEIKMGGLAPGYYAVLIGTKADFSRDKEAAAISNTWCSNLGFVQKTSPDGQSGFYVFDRHSGKPLKGVNAQLWEEKYNRSANKEELVKWRHFTTDKHGYFKIPEKTKNRYNRYLVDFKYKGDRLFLDDSFTAGRRYPQRIDKSHTRTFFFTDRSIYRPGQTVHFKGIIIETGGKQTKNRILSDHKTSAAFFDVNHQKISSQDFVSNQFGTFSGSFTIPSGGITGIMNIGDEHGSVSFSVEEYKRPRFEVTFQPLSGSFKLNEMVKVSGKAKSYAGANIDNGAVNYRVVREARFPYWRYSWRWPGFSSDKMEILNGAAVTGANGDFEIEFPALPDPQISPERSPIFNFTVYADVTDIGGETHSAQTTVSVGYTALSVDVSLPQTLNREDIPEVNITTENLNGEFEAASGTIAIYQLKDPGRIFRQRFWKKPDRFIMDKEAYYAAFPNDAYNDEDDYRNWEKGAKVFEYRFDTGESKSFSLSKAASWAPGKYMAELSTADKFGKEIKLARFFTLYSLKEKSTPDHALSWHSAVKSGGEPGEKAKFSWGSAAGDVHALLEVYHQGKISKSHWIKTNDKKNTLQFRIREKHRGNFSFSLFFVKFGRVHIISEVINVPWSNKDLKITYQTFRDKLKPGQQEEWRVKIAGPAGEKVAAEMLAGMYDASLDAFRSHDWQFNIYPFFFRTYSGGFNYRGAFASHQVGAHGIDWNTSINIISRQYDQLDFWVSSGYFYGRGGGGLEFDGVMRKYSQGVMAAQPALPGPEDSAHDLLDAEESLEEKNGETVATQANGPAEVPGEASFENVQVRANLNETAFFFPDLRTNGEGEIILSFTMPEALTRWKFLGLAHTKDLKYSLTEQTVTTQKELMVVPNAPRFFREGDHITFTGKVSNLTEDDLSGSAILKLFDALTMTPVDDQLGNQNGTISFTAKAGQSAPLSWDLEIPEGVQALTYQIIAKAGNFSDGEENMTPVLTNRMLVTESLPLPMRGKQTKTFKFDKFLKSGKSKTLRHQNFTLEFTSNPVWYAVQALPYMMEYPYECSEQIFSRYYANSIARHIANSNPKIKRVFDIWAAAETGALLSNLEKNQELKSLLLEETPWVLQAKDETERKKRTALLFDLNKMNRELQSALRKLQQMQLGNGAWPWFPGMRGSRYITTHIIAGMGHLDRLGITEIRGNKSLWRTVTRAIYYLDAEMNKDYQDLLKHKVDLINQNIGHWQIQYLYARSYFPELSVNDQHQTAFDYWKSQAEEFWLPQNKYMQGMIALFLHRFGNSDKPGDIIKSLKEHALHSEEFGMYWKENAGGYYWYQAPIETQALLIEAFDEVAGDQSSVDDMKVWLLKQKQTQDWKTTKATAEACYALLRQGTDWLANDRLVEIFLGGQKIDPNSGDDVKPEAGTGYFKTSWHGSDIQLNLGEVTVTKKDEGVAWGALYWQYFEQLDKITTHDTPLKLKKKLFLQENTPTGPELQPISERTRLKPGDLVKVRIELKVDRHLEYVHMKDMRASALEPLNVISQYKYQGGVGYYESTRDASTNFFFAYLPKGTYVFEYPLRVTHTGNFSNGITSIQCMYAPEFTSHSEGVRISVGE